MIIDVMNTKEHSFRSIPFADGNVVHSVGDPHKAKEDFDFVASMSLKEGITKTWEWYQQHSDFYD